jgi:NADH-quinone oxidoreductase subunit G
MSLEKVMVKIYIDTIEYEVEEGKNLLETCLSLGLDLPYFCWHPEIDSIGACRQCAVIQYKDENDDKGKLTMACLLPVADNLRVSIDAEKAKNFRAHNIEALMVNHPHDCPVCDEGGECHLQDMTVMTGHNYRRYRFNKRTHNNQYLGPFINHEMNRCIQCYRCVRFYKDYAGGKDLDVFGVHDNLYFGRYEPGTLESEFSGNLVEICPTGVFTDKTLQKHYARKWDLTNAPSVCHNCSLGCNILASERYGSIRRILSRYNGEVNGYFLCDRGRFGYEYVNSPKRIQTPFKKENDSVIQQKKTDAVNEIINLLNSGKATGISSPKASLESNFLLQLLVGKENFYAGISKSEGKLVQKVIEITKSATIHTPSLNEVKDYDAALVLGEDVTNTAPMLALNIRQAAKNQPAKQAKKIDIPEWNDTATREVVQEQRGPLFIAAAHQTKLDDIATQTAHSHPANIARLGHAIAHQINPDLPNPNENDETTKLAKTIAEELLNAKKPLIVSGTSLHDSAVLEAAANVALALNGKDKNPGLINVVPEVNSVGLSLMTDKFLEQAFQNEKEKDTLIILENDLYRRADKKSTDDFLQQYKNVIVLDYLENETTAHATHILPAGTFAESDGTVVNNEGRAQRFYQVHVPRNDIQASWKWLQELLPDEAAEKKLHLDGIIEKLTEAYPELEQIKSAAPRADYRKGTQKIPRETHRFSGRTAKDANIDVNEPQPPDDPDSPLSYSMEGYHGVPPGSVTPFYWSPGWNSAQAINKYQIEVGGEPHHGNPGVRLFAENGNHELEYFETIPKEFTAEKGKWTVLPIYHIFGSEVLSAQSPAVKKRVPESYIALNKTDAANAGINEGDKVEILVQDKTTLFPVKILPGLAEGTAGLPKNLDETAGIGFPFQSTLKKVKDE